MSQEARIAVVENKVENLEEKTAEIKETMVTQVEVSPMRAILYGMIGIILTAFMSGLVYLVFRTH